MRRSCHGWLALGFAGTLAGCHHPPTVVYEDYGHRAQMIVSSAPPVTNAYATLLAAAEGAEKASPNASRNTTFAPATQKHLKESLAPQVQRIRQAAYKPVEFPYTPRKPFEPAPGQRGWRLLGRVMVWTEQSAAGLKDYDKAISYAVDGTRFGFSLTSGNATDAALGLTIADEARRSLTPVLDNMSAAQLDRLASGYEQALLKKPTLTATFKHEHQGMMMAVQYVQDCYDRDDLKSLRDNLGPDIRDAVDYLKEMPADEKASYFAGFAGEADTEATYLDGACLQPARKRVAPDPGKARRPWKRFSKAFFQTGRPLMTMNDTTLARSRMMVATCRILAMRKRGQPIPDKLTSIVAKSLAQDPFSGRPFVFKASGDQFRLYSVGADFRDDGGETDPESFQTPDLTLERAGD